MRRWAPYEKGCGYGLPWPAVVALLAVLMLPGCAASQRPLAGAAQPGAAQPGAALVAARAAGLDTLGIVVAAGASRPFVYTDGQAAFFYGEAAGPHRTGWQGFNVRGFAVLDDWAWDTPAGRAAAGALAEATVWPDHARRRYAGGLEERLTLLDGTRPDQAVLVVEPVAGAPTAFLPLLADSRDPAYFAVRTDGDVLLVARQGRLATAEPAWLAVHAPAARAEVRPDTVAVGGVDRRAFAPGRLVLEGAAPVVLAVADAPEAAAALAREAAAEAAARRAARAARMQRLLEAAYVRTRDARFNRAFAWARLALDALVMNQRGKGLFAGLPWFNNYWGRDTFIALPGALLVTGQWEAARQVLQAFAAYQDATPGSPTFGRIPNFVALDNVTYNTADGTPWFVRALDAYLAASGDTAFAAQMAPVVRRATDGALFRTDAHGLLTHGDQETWMDASAGPGQEWSPRGNRAVEVQALFFDQLRLAARLLRRQGDEEAARAYEAATHRLAAAFEARFLAPDGSLYDHLDPDGTPDAQVRPNVFFALGALPDPAPLTRRYAERLVYPWGVASLWQGDPAFHPFHEAPRYYPKDAAYHNGTIWTWLTGPLVSLMTAQGVPDLAYDQTRYLAEMALTRGAVGTMAENSDALPHPGEALPRLTGTVSQAWTLAEFVRNAFEDYAGVRYLAPDTVALRPRLPTAWGETAVRFRVGTGAATATLTPRADVPSEFLGAAAERVQALDVTLVPEGAEGVVVEVQALGGLKRVRLGRRPVVVQMVREEGSGAAVTFARLDGAVVGISETRTPPDSAAWAGFAWQKPRALDGIPALQGPGWPLLARADVKRRAAGAPLRLRAADPRGDDRGPAGTYVYPTHPAFQPGILDVLGLEIREDDDNLYVTLQMAALSQPGWNPQYGFQLTFAALLFDTGAGGQPAVGRGAAYRLPDGQAYDLAVFVGGGLRVEAADATVLAEYRPAAEDVADPLGTVDTGRIAFSLPRHLLPPLPPGTRVTLLVGGQDDHGGAGVGDFRAVEAAASDWAGGGRQAPDAPNVYDVLTGTLTAPEPPRTP